MLSILVCFNDDDQSVKMNCSLVVLLVKSGLLCHAAGLTAYPIAWHHRKYYRLGRETAC